MSEEAKYRKWAWIALSICLVVSAFMAYQATRIGFDYDFERFFPEDDPQTTYFLEHREKYSSENDYILFSLVNEKGIFDQEFLREAKRFQDSLATLNHVVQVRSILDLSEPIKDPLFGTYFERPYMRWDEPEHYAIDSARIYNSPDLINSFVTQDARGMAIVLDHEQFLSKLKCDSLADDIITMLPSFTFDRIVKSGRAIGQRYVIERLQRELLLFVSASMLLILAFLFIAFRTAWGVIVPMIVVFLSIFCLLGIMYLTGKGIDLLLTILPTILFVVGMSDVVHILSKYFNELRQGSPKLEAIKKSVKEVGLATFLTSLTTAIGFLTLMSSSIVPIQEFGIYSAVGVLIAFILAFTILPAVMILTPVPNLIQEKKAEDFWTARLHRLYRWVIRQRRAIGWATLGVVLISLLGVSRVKVNNFLLEDLRADDPVKVEFDYFEKEYAGMRPFEMALMVTDTSESILSPRHVRSLDKLDRYLREDYGAGFIVSPVSFIKSLNKAAHNGNADYYTVPEEDGQVRKLARDLERVRSMEAVSQFMTDDLRECRIGGKIGDWGMIRTKAKDKGLAEFWNAEMADSGLKYHITGTATLIDLNNEYLSTTMIWGLLFAFLIVALIIGLLYRSWKMVIIALIPNILPLLMVGAVMGFTGINLKVSTSIIFTIAFGIAVDDTIHFVSRMRLELAKGRTRQYALKRSFIGTGKAIIITSLILIGGFLMLILSDFKGTFYTGSLLSLTLLFAVVVDLLLLPVLVWGIYGKEDRGN